MGRGTRRCGAVMTSWAWVTVITVAVAIQEVVAFPYVPAAYTGNAVASGVVYDSRAGPCAPSQALRGRRYQPHPQRSDVYIVCTLYGGSYVQHCPTGLVWHQDTERCGAPAGPQLSLQLPATLPSTRRGYGIKSVDSLKKFVTGHEQPMMDNYKQLARQKQQSLAQNGKKSGVIYTANVDSAKSRPHEVRKYGPVTPRPNSKIFQPKFKIPNVDQRSQVARIQAKNIPAPKAHYKRMQKQQKSVPESVQTKSVKTSPQVHKSIELPAASMQTKSVKTAPQVHKYISAPTVLQTKSVHSPPQVHTSIEAAIIPQHQPLVGSSASDDVGLSAQLSPCTHPNIRYVSHPLDLSRYIECQHGVATERQCDASDIWVQPLRQCMNHEERLGDAMPPQKPCVYATTRFNPHPHNPRKYIECLSWYTTQERLCPHTHLWVQSEQRCMQEQVVHPVRTVIKSNGPHLHRYSRLTDEMVAGSSSSGNWYPGLVCTDSSNYYHPYPQNSNKFIQCDQYGNMYVRECGEGKIWNDNAKTCSGDGTSSDIAESDDGAFAGADDSDEFYEPTGVDEDFSPQCIDGHIWDASYQMCVSAHSLPLIPVDGTLEIQYHTTDTPPLDTDVAGDITVHTEIIDGEEVRIETRVYNGENPCVAHDNQAGPMGDFYYQFSVDPTFFIQCDQQGNMFIQPCGEDKVWSPEAVTCVSTMLPQTLDPDASDADQVPTLSIGNPCLDLLDDTSIYHPHPFQLNMFVVCVGEVPYTYHCPDGTIWDDPTVTCQWPEAAGDEEEVEYNQWE